MIALISEKVRRVMEAEGISEDELEHMIQHAAPTTNERGNRRFHHWLFAINPIGAVLNMSYMEVPVQYHQGTTDMEAYDECPNCEGHGCKACGWTGEVHVKYQAAKRT